MIYYAELWLGEPIEDCKLIARNNDDLFEKYDLNKKEWIPFDEFSDIYLGERLVERISEEEANRIIDYKLEKKKKQLLNIRRKLNERGYNVDKLDNAELVKLWRKVND